jgi:hypothetical protein
LGKLTSHTFIFIDVGIQDSSNSHFADTKITITGGVGDASSTAPAASESLAAKDVAWGEKRREKSDDDTLFIATQSILNIRSVCNKHRNSSRE